MKSKRRVIITIKCDVTEFFHDDWEAMSDQELREWITDLPEAIAFQDETVELVTDTHGNIIHKVERREE